MSRLPDLVPPSVPRSPWQRLYGAAHALRRRRAAATARRLPVPVVSLGNLHWGGTGKTPLTAAIACHLRDAGRRVAVLSRGYRGQAPGPLLVSRGEGPLVGAELAGDEPVALAAELAGVALAVGRDRFAAGELALAELVPAPDLFLLDDGFSHVALARDLDLLAVPAVDPWAGGRLPPGGRLREPLASSRHAQALLVTGNGATSNLAREIARSLAAFGFAGPGFAAPTRIDLPRLANGTLLADGTSVLLVAGIARPERFLTAAGTQKVQIRGQLLFSDHHAYPPASLSAIERAFAVSGAAVVLTTAKDRVKLEARLHLPLAVLPVAAEPEPAFWAWLDRTLAELPGVKNAPLLHRFEYGALLAIKGLLRALPHAGSRAFGAGLGGALHRFDARHRTVVRQNLARAFPQLSDGERREIARRCFRHVGAAFCDALSIQRFDRAELCRRVDSSGWERLRAAEQDGRGVLVMGAHLGNWEVVALTLGAQHGPLQAVGRPADNPWFDREVQRLRTRFGNVSLAKHGSVRRMLRVLHEGGRVGMLIDQRVKPHEGIAAPFFGASCWTSPLLARLALRTGAPIVPAFGDHLPGGRYRVEFHEPIRPEGKESEASVLALTVRCLEEVERAIRARPESWLWLHDRWRGLA